MKTPTAPAQVPSPGNTPDGDELKTLSLGLKAKLETYAAGLVRVSRFVKGLLVVGGAALAGLGQYAAYPTSKAGFIVGCVGVALALAGGLWVLFVDETAPQLLSDAHAAIEVARTAKVQLDSKTAELETLKAEFVEESAQSENDLNRLAELYTTSRLMNEAVENEIVSGGSDIAKSVQKLIDIVVRQIHSLLEFHGGEGWTLSVFRAEGKTPASRVLKHIASQRADRPDESKTHRNWKPGEGVAGHAFQTGRELIIGNAYDPETAGWLYVPDENQREDDSQRYVSFAAVPIKVPGVKDPWGIVVATSDIVDRFETDGEGKGNQEIEPLRMIAGQIALLAAYDYVKVANGPQTYPTIESKRSRSAKSSSKDAGTT